ncbi:MAG: SLC13 family permease, partial [Candidatus Sumerlaeota bacterium]
PGSLLVGKTPGRLDLRERFGINILGAARQGYQLREQLGNIQLVVGDILLVQGREESLLSGLHDMGCLPLASRGLRIGKPRKVLLASLIFAAVMVLIAFGVVPAATGLVLGALIMVLAGLISPGEIYDSIDMPVIVLLAAMLPVGQALETTGGSQLIADALLNVAQSVPPVAMLACLMVAVMLLSNVINNVAATILAAPVAINIAQGLALSVDPFLMAVAIGASSAFLTPIGHQSNTLVMEPGGYRFGDYWRMGLPLSLLVVAGSIPLILWIWPL